MSMKQFDHKQVRQRFLTLPESVQDAILSEELADAFAAAMTHAGLQGDRMRVCNQQATLVAVGLATTVEFEAFVKSDLRLDETRANKLLGAVHASVFTPLRKALVTALEQKKRVSTDAAVSAAQTPPTREVPTTSTSTAQKEDPYREPIGR